MSAAAAALPGAAAGGGGWSKSTWSCNSCGFRLSPLERETCVVCGSHWKTRRPQQKGGAQLGLANQFSPLAAPPPPPPLLPGLGQQGGRGKGQGNGRRARQQQRPHQPAQASGGAAAKAGAECGDDGGVGDEQVKEVDLEALRRTHGEVVKALGAQHPSATALAEELESRQQRSKADKPLHIRLLAVNKKIGQQDKKKERASKQVEEAEQAKRDAQAKLEQAQGAIDEAELSLQGLRAERDSLLAAGAKEAGVAGLEPDFWKKLGLQGPKVPRTFATAKLVEQFHQCVAGLRRCQLESAVNDQYGGEDSTNDEDMFQSLLEGSLGCDPDDFDGDQHMEQPPPEQAQDREPKVVLPPERKTPGDHEEQSVHKKTKVEAGAGAPRC